MISERKVQPIPLSLTIIRIISSEPVRTIIMSNNGRTAVEMIGIKILMPDLLSTLTRAAMCNTCTKMNRKCRPKKHGFVGLTRKEIKLGSRSQAATRRLPPPASRRPRPPMKMAATGPMETAAVHRNSSPTKLSINSRGNRMISRVPSKRLRTCKMRMGRTRSMSILPRCSHRTILRESQRRKKTGAAAGGGSQVSGIRVVRN